MVTLTREYILQSVALYMKDLKESSARDWDNFLVNMMDDLNMDVDSEPEMADVEKMVEKVLDSLI